MRSLAGCLVCAVLIWTATVAKATADGLLTYFSEEVPPAIPKPEALSSEDQIVLAKVRVLSRPAYLVGPDQSGQPPQIIPREPWSAWLQVLDVIRGKRPEMERITARFGGDRSYARGPSTLHQLAQEYVVAMYEDSSGYHLIGVPISADKYRDWQRVITESDLERANTPDQGRPRSALRIMSGPAVNGSKAGTTASEETVTRRFMRSREELRPVAIELVRDAELVNRFWAVRGSDNEELARQFIDEVAQRAQQIDSNVTYADAARITVILMEMLAGSGHDAK